MILFTHSPISQMGAMELSLTLELFLEDAPELGRRLFFEACRRRSFSSMTCRTYSRCIAILCCSISRSSSSESRGGEAMALGDDAVLELEMLLLSSKGSQRKRSSSERKEVARSSCSDSDKDDRRGHEGKAQVASRAPKLEGVMLMGADMELKELYDPNELYMAIYVCCVMRVESWW